MNVGNTTADTGEQIRLVIGLGNPGREYHNTRHNVGFAILDELASQNGASWSMEKKWEAEVTRIGDCFLEKPQTFMNLSGRAVSALCRFHKIAASEILVVYDDVDLDLGRLRFRAAGSAAGHNGIKSIIQSLGTQNFARLKFGIGRTADSVPNEEKGRAQGELTGHVLGKFTGTEREELEKRVAQAVDAVNYALSQGLKAAMNVFNEQPEIRQKKENKSAAEVDKGEIKSEISNKETGTSEV